MEQKMQWDISSPGISFCLEYGRILVFRKTLELLENPQYYRFLFNPDDRIFAVQSCNMNDPGAHKLPKLGSGDSYKIKSKDLVRFIYQCCNWAPKASYRIAGCFSQAEKLVLFELNAALELSEGKVVGSTE